MHALLLPLLIGLTTAAAEPPDVVVVCPQEFRAAMQPWLERREKQGHTVQFISNEPTPVEIREQIRTIAKSGKLRFVLLVGDAPTSNSTAVQRANRTPTFKIPAPMNRVWSGEPDVASDNPYADLNDDRVPDLAIGRLTARTADELAVIVKRILAYEESQDFGPWRRRINFVAGEAGFGATLDTTMEMVVRRLIGGALPPAYQTTMTYASWRSPFCPDPRSFHQQSLERMNEGCLFWVFMGHGAPQTVQWAMFPDGATPILQCEDCAKLHCGATPPIVLCMCCYTGAFAEEQSCLAEELLRSPGGPVGVFSGSSVTMPYGMTAMGIDAISDYFEHPSDTLGEWILTTKRDMVAGYNLPIWSLVNAATITMMPAIMQPKEERLEHLQLFNLLGDPTMRLNHPAAVSVKAPATAAAGETISIDGKSDIVGTVNVELIVPPMALPASSRTVYDDSPQGQKQFDSTYKAANGHALTTATADVQADGTFHTKLQLPQLAGNYRVRAFVEGKTGCALGASDLKIENADAKRADAKPAPLHAVGSK
ncbi:MAG TPA: C25 family cysteine peptidase [Pirellulales bacterium]|jgi:hypothetical protein